jgi:hypothetical protein
VTVSKPNGRARHLTSSFSTTPQRVLHEEAVPSLYRAGRVVVAGDRHQLPPTVFYATAVEGGDDIRIEDETERFAMEGATAAIGSLESMLGTPPGMGVE